MTHVYSFRGVAYNAGVAHVLIAAGEMQMDSLLRSPLTVALSITFIANHQVVVEWPVDLRHLHTCRWTHCWGQMLKSGLTLRTWAAMSMS